jgi:hypothetical protein
MFAVAGAACVLAPWPEPTSVRDVLLGLGALAGFMAMAVIAWESGS